MAAASARARFVRIAPRKIRLVADLIRGRKVSEARDILQYTPKGAAPVVGKLLASAVANAESAAAERRERIDADAMVIREVLVDGGPTIRRFQGAPHGRMVRIRKRTSHIELQIGD